jgi:GrpB-like predicted nucleotidyltransferase (UPF0157 family)/GNAT superfamily N-acetyltransferase
VVYIVTRIMEVVPYDLNWPKQFEAEAELLKQALGDNCVAIHHIGSTAVPGLAAKPTIDIIPVVKDLSKIDDNKLVVLGYAPRGEMGMPFRSFYNKGEPRTYHLHIWEEDNPEIEKHLLFRDYLIAHPDAANKYENLKLQLANKFRNDRQNYTGSKDALIKEIIQKSGFMGLTVVRVLLDSELAAYHQIRRTQIFDKLPNIIYDPNHPTMNAENHYHYILMRGVVPVSIAQIEMLDAKTVALRSLATDALYKNMGYGSYLLGLMERWVKQQGGTKILMHAAPRAESFYRERGYVDMEFNDVGVNPDNVNLGRLL